MTGRSLHPDLKQPAPFAPRHIGPGADEVRTMLDAIGAADLATLIDETLPAAIRLGRELHLPDALTERGAQVEQVIAYQNRAPEIDKTVSQQVGDDPIDLVVFSSPSAIHHAYEVFGEREASALLAQSTIACLGSTTAAAARARGLRVEVQPEQSSTPSLVEAICAHYSAL